MDQEAELPLSSHIRRLSGIAALAAALVASHQRPAIAQAQAGVRDAEALYATALASGDVETAVTFFDENGTLMIDGCPGVVGRSDIRSFLIRFSRSDRVVSLTPEDLTQTGGDIAREVGSFRVTAAHPAAKLEAGRYVASWSRIGRDWRIGSMVLSPDGRHEADDCGSMTGK